MVNEVFGSIDHWRSLYAKLTSEYNAYNAQVENHFKKQLDKQDLKIQSLTEEKELNELKNKEEIFNLQAANRTLCREKSALILEIKCLKEVIKDLEAEERNRTKDEQKKEELLNTSHNNNEKWKAEKEEFLVQIEILDRRNEFLEEEINALIQNNEKMRENILTMAEEYDSKLKDLNTLLYKRNAELEAQKNTFNKKFQDSKELLKTKQAYLEELSLCIQDRDKESQSAMQGIQDFVQNLLLEANESLLFLGEKVIEKEKKQANYKNSLLAKKDEISTLQSEMKSLKTDILNLSQNIYKLISSGLLDSLPEKSFLIFGPMKNERKENGRPLKAIKELNHIYKLVSFWKRESEDHIHRLNHRTKELEDKMKKREFDFTINVENLCQKVKAYKEIIRRLAKNNADDTREAFNAREINYQSPMSKYSPKHSPLIESKKNQEVQEERKINDEVGGDETMDEINDEEIDFLKEKHARFSDILDNLDDYVKNGNQIEF